MKILRITLQNIASLAGLQTVDFTVEPLRSTGLYSISGSTGSGKSSILDALCLALYDRCPRLEGIGRLEELVPGERQSDPRSLLRRGAAEGLAEVAFQGVDDRQWTARWTVRRSRKKVDGKLQAANVSLFEGHIPPAGEGQLAEGGRKTDVLASIEKHIGLSYDQFTRAVLLAQNDFAAFLKADDRERAEILQALTGTEQFEVISKAIHARQTEERRALEKLEAQLDGATALSDEDRETLSTRKKELVEQVAALTKDLRARDEQLEWFRIDKERETELQNVSQQLDAFKAKLADCAPILQQLEHTEMAQREARTLRETQKQATINAAQAVDESQAAAKVLKEQEKHAESLKAEEENAVKAVAATAKARDELQSRLRTAREIQAQIAPVKDSLKKAEAARDAAKQRFTAAEKQQKQTEKKRSLLTTEHQELTEQQRGLAKFEPFAESLDLWLDRLDKAAEARLNVDRSEKAVAVSQKELQVASIALEKLSQQSQQLATERSQAKTNLENAAKNADKFDTEKIASDRDDVAGQLTELQSVATYVQALNTAQREHAELSEQIAATEKTLQETQAALTQLKSNELPKAEGERKGHESALRLLKAQISDEATRLRTELQEDQPCPVCGSKSHPFENHAATNAVAEIEKELTASQKRVRELEQLIGRHESTLQTESRQLKDQQQKLAKLELQKKEIQAPQVQHAFAKKLLPLPVEEQLSAATDRISELQKQQEQLTERDREARAAAKLLADARETFQASEQAYSELEQHRTKQQADVSVAENRRDSDVKLVSEAQTVSRNILQPLQEVWAAIPGAEQAFLETPKEFQTSFRQQSQQWIEQNSQLKKVATQLEQIEHVLVPERKAATQAKASHQATETDCNEITKSLAELTGKLSALFGSESPDAVEKSAQEKQATATTALENTRKQRSDTEQQLGAARRDESEKSKHVETTRRQQNDADKAMNAWLEDFSDRRDAKCNITALDEMLSRDAEWMNKQRLTVKELQDAVKTSEGSRGTLKQQLEQHRKQRPTEKTSEDVQKERDQLVEQVTQQEHERDKVNGQLLADDQQRKKNETLALKVQEKRLSAEPWLKLNELLGSADGAKFRGIAQRQTLDILLEYANAQLENLSNRYRLERLPNCLNLIVIDLHMAEERRSVHSLSGGESFLVSLALALGLASLTSNRLRIESLFIDEGFGSLDPETLSVAMSALMHLESQGRKVGVISHVSEMTDAIPIQIKVVKGSNGTATIEVPCDG